MATAVFKDDQKACGYVRGLFQHILLADDKSQKEWPAEQSE